MRKRARCEIKADGQYLKVVVEDELGVEIELDQRSEGFQWLVSFFVVFFAEAADKHKNAILLLDEPGLHLHGLKQRDFRETISRLAAKNQTLYTTHSPFLVGPRRAGHGARRGHDGPEGRDQGPRRRCRREIRPHCCRSRKHSATTWRRASSRRRATSCWKG